MTYASRDSKARATQLRPLLRVLAVAGLACALGSGRPSFGQPQGPAVQMNPVYVDDSPAASDSFVRIGEHLAGRNLDEAVRVAQILLDDQGDRVVPRDGAQAASGADRLISVRTAVHRLLMSSPDLLQRYRSVMNFRAERLLNEGQAEQVERTLLLTPAGLAAALRLAQSQIEDARFHAARLTLQQLDVHPDRTGEAGVAAARLATLLARYLDRADVRDLAARWSQDAKKPVTSNDLQPMAWPATATARAASPLLPTAPLNNEGLIAKPLWTTPLSNAPAGPDAAFARAARSNVQLPPFAANLLMMPSAWGDTVIVNDGTQITALDRFTLAMRWAISPGVADAPDREGVAGDQRRMERWAFGMGGRSDDIASVAVQGRFVVAATGRGTEGGRADGDMRLHGLDTLTGRLRWSSSLSSLDASLTDATVRGPIHIYESTAVIAGRKYIPERRLTGLVLAGVDVASGQLRWARNIGSAGSMPWVQQSLGADGTLVHDGVAYRVDRLGVVGAVEIATGRVVWVHKLPVDAAATLEAPTGFQINEPIVDGQSIVIIAPDGKRVLRMDLQTGDILAERPLTDFTTASPKYLLRVGNTLVGVGDDRLSFVSIAQFESDKITLSAPLSPPGIRGRVVLAGKELLVPSISGLLVMDPAHPEKPRQIALDDSGNVLPLDSQLVVVDDSRVHSYLRWEVADKILSQRIQDQPGDPKPAVTLAELAYRAGRPDRIVDAARIAQRVLAQAAPGEETVSSRNRLIQAVQQMLADTLEPQRPAPVQPSQTVPIPQSERTLTIRPDGRGEPATPPPVPAPPAPAPQVQAAAPVLADARVTEQLILILGEMAQTPEEKIAFTLANGRFGEQAGKLPEAVAAYQRVLLDPSLGQATWRGPQISIRGELEAARRLEALVRKHGTSIYAAQEQAAAAELAAFGPAPTIAQLESVAQRYPMAQLVCSLYQRVSDQYLAEGKPTPAVFAAEQGLRAALQQPEPPPGITGELAGRLILDLRERQQYSAASGVLRSVQAAVPNIVLTSKGAPLNTAELGEELLQRLAQSARWPRVGLVSTEGGQAIVGAAIVEPLLTARRPTVNNLLVLQGDDDVSVWAPASTAAAAVQAPAAAAGQMGKVWTKPLGDGGRAYLIKQFAGSAFLLTTRDGDGVVDRVGPTGPESKWTSPKLSALFGREDTRGIRRLPGIMADRFVTPGEGDQSPTSVLVAMDDRTLALVQRSGRAVGLDIDTGEVLWTISTGIQRVYDVDLLGGTLVVAGDSEIAGPGNTIIDLRPGIQSIDARTGRLGQRLGERLGKVRWVRLTEAGLAQGIGVGAGAAGPAVIAALDAAVVSIDLANAQPNWTIQTPELMPVSAMWTFGDQLVLMSSDRVLWLGSLSSGRVRPAPLEIAPQRMNMAQTIDAFPLSSLPGSGFAVSTNQGLVIFAADGTMLGSDGFDGGTSMVRPQPAQGRAVTIETIADGRTGDGMMLFSLHALDVSDRGSAAVVDSRSVLLGARPTSMTLLDGRVAVTAGNVTVVMRALP